jgi:hypothetical protein
MHLRLQSKADLQSVQVYLVLNLMIQENQASRLETEGLAMMAMMTITEKYPSIDNLNPFKKQENRLKN